MRSTKLLLALVLFACSSNPTPPLTQWQRAFEEFWQNFDVTYSYFDYKLPHVTIMGDTTGGSSGNPKMFQLANGWSYTVPRWIAYTADMQVIEWKGIAPDVVIPTAGLDFSNTDPLIEAARAYLH